MDTIPNIHVVDPTTIKTLKQQIIYEVEKGLMLSNGFEVYFVLEEDENGQLEWSMHSNVDPEWQHPVKTPVDYLKGLNFDLETRLAIYRAACLVDYYRDVGDALSGITPTILGVLKGVDESSDYLFRMDF